MDSRNLRISDVPALAISLLSPLLVMLLMMMVGCSRQEKQLFEEANTLYEQENYEAARSTFKSLLSEFPNSRWKLHAHYYIAESFYSEKNYHEAHHAFNRIMTEPFKDYPDLQAWALFKSAYSLHQLGRYSDAIPRYMDLINKFPEHQNVPIAYFNRGLCYEAEKNYDEALANYRLSAKKAHTTNYAIEGQRSQEIHDARNRINIVKKIKDAQHGFSNASTVFQKPSQNASQTRRLQPQEITKKSLRSAVLLLKEEPHREAPIVGSGFFISDTHVVSQWHLLEGSSDTLIIKTDDLTIYDIEEVTAKDVPQDIVILKVSGKGTPLPLGDSDAVQIGEEVYTTSHPNGWTPESYRADISGFKTLQSGERIQLSVPVALGSSGGALLNNKGEVIGIVYEAYSAIEDKVATFAIPINSLKELINQ